MPSCGSQLVLCDLPVRFDTYAGCSHGCTYCFTRRNGSIHNVKALESVAAVDRFIQGKRTADCRWCDWDIPLHWGGMSDPFQPLEKKHRASYAVLELFAATGYPFAFSTKGKLVATPEYLALLRRCNAVAQVSMVAPQYDALEPGAPRFAERLDMLPKLAETCKRVIVRISPYSLGLVESVRAALPLYAARGVYGVEIQGMKRGRKRPGMIRVGADWCYPVAALRAEYTAIKAAAHECGLAFFCGENRLRSLSDASCCCGVEGVPGFRPNRANLNRLVFGQPLEFTAQMEAPDTGNPFRSITQSSLIGDHVNVMTYAACMRLAARSRPFLRAMGLLPEEPEKEG